MNNLYVPGCVLMSYKPYLADKLIQFLETRYSRPESFYTCCFQKPDISPDTRILTPCVACMDVYEKRGYTVEFLLSYIA